MYFFFTSHFSGNLLWFIIYCWHVCLNLHLFKLFLHLFGLLFLSLFIVLLIIQKFLYISFILVLGRHTSMRFKRTFLELVLFLFFSNSLLSLVFTRFKIFRSFLETANQLCMRLWLLELLFLLRDLSKWAASILTFT